MSGTSKTKHENDSISSPATSKKCGIVMPISSIDGCNEHHWSDVLRIVSDSIDAAGFEPSLVSDADEVGFISKRIVHNIYDNPIVVCDVSAKNPNVMFELGMRLAFDKPTIIIKDDKTAYSFDIGGIEHLSYPRDLRFSSIVDFKQKLTEKIVATSNAATNDPHYTTFLKHFGEFVVAKLDRKEVSSQEFILEELRSIRQAMATLERSQSVRRIPIPDHDRLAVARLKLRGSDRAEHAEFRDKIQSHPEVLETRLIRRPSGTYVEIFLRPEAESRVIAQVRKLFATEEGPIEEIT